MHCQVQYDEQEILHQIMKTAWILHQMATMYYKNEKSQQSLHTEKP